MTGGISLGGTRGTAARDGIEGAAIPGSSSRSQGETVTVQGQGQHNLQPPGRQQQQPSQQQHSQHSQRSQQLQQQQQQQQPPPPPPPQQQQWQQAGGRVTDHVRSVPAPSQAWPGSQPDALAARQGMKRMHPREVAAVDEFGSGDHQRSGIDGGDGVGMSPGQSRPRPWDRGDEGENKVRRGADGSSWPNRMVAASAKADAQHGRPGARELGHGSVGVVADDQERSPFTVLENTLGEDLVEDEMAAHASVFASMFGAGDESQPVAAAGIPASRQPSAQRDGPAGSQAVTPSQGVPRGCVQEGGPGSSQLGGRDGMGIRRAQTESGAVNQGPRSSSQFCGQPDLLSTRSGEIAAADGRLRGDDLSRRGGGQAEEPPRSARAWPSMGEPASPRPPLPPSSQARSATQQPSQPLSASTTLLLGLAEDDEDDVFAPVPKPSFVSGSGRR
eukprot:jgi/Mesvir1/19053/Mv12815-RA.1